jgi:hypothetical protein
MGTFIIMAVAFGYSMGGMIHFLKFESLAKAYGLKIKYSP